MNDQHRNSPGNGNETLYIDKAHFIIFPSFPCECMSEEIEKFLADITTELQDLIKSTTINGKCEMME